MDNFSPANSLITISNGRIEDITFDDSAIFITILYSDCVQCKRAEQRVRLVVGPYTLILDENGNEISASDLNIGTLVNAVFSSAMTRSIPPQTTAFVIRVVRNPLPDNIITGRILDIDRQNRSFTTISNGTLSSIIRFNVSNETRILTRNGVPIAFSRLLPGMRVRIRHASFMTTSIPPQTTALEIRIL